GHSDVIVGLLCTTKERIKKIFSNDYMILGGVISPNDASLVLRGLRTLEIRMKKSDESCKKVVSYLQNHPKIERVIYPFAKDFPQYELAKKQMSGCGGLFSILLKANEMKEVENFFHRLERFLFAVSWGGYESLALPFCAFHNISGKANSSKPWNLIRFYIGLEDPDWLIADLEQALLHL
ncbi:MAG TPA: PLP-dependent transferase, partial [Saprospiraceae bacterium]|nr:PLP-dependent transferase [Saprospiraceae bacterium]